MIWRKVIKNQNTATATKREDDQEARKSHQCDTTYVKYYLHIIQNW